MNFSFSFSGTRFSNGDAKVRFIFKLPNFFEKIFKVFFQRQSFSRTLTPFQAPLFRFGIAKVDIFSLPPNYLQPQNRIFCRLKVVFMP